MTGRVIVLRGDAACLPLPDGSVDLIVTSPPFYGLRSYTDGGERYDGQIGSEATPREFIDALLTCTREWMRVLKPSGSMFVDLGDSYYSGKGAPGKTTTDPKNAGRNARRTTRSPLDYGLDVPPKSLLLLPERYRTRCLDELGLIVREVIEWHKPNPLPESAKDRCGRAHEDLVHLVKQPHYYAAVDEIREPTPNVGRKPKNVKGGALRGAHGSAGHDGNGMRMAEEYNNPLGKTPGSVWTIPSAPLNVPDHVAHARCCGGRKRPGCEDGLEHYAAFPPALVTPIIQGWSPSGICVECGEGRRPVTHIEHERGWVRATAGGRHRSGDGNPGERVGQVVSNRKLATITGYACACTPYTDHPGTTGRERNGQGYARETGRDAHPRTGPWREYHLERWTPPPTRPAVVADPCGGTGTTGLVASVLGRIGIVSDRSADYCRLATWRTSDPGERARALGVPKPPPVMDGQGDLFDLEAS